MQTQTRVTDPPRSSLKKRVSIFWFSIRSAAVQLWNESGSPRAFQSSKTEADYQAKVVRSAVVSSKLQFAVCSAIVVPACVMDLLERRNWGVQFVAWDGSMSIVATLANAMLIVLSAWAMLAFFSPRTAEQLISALVWHRLLALFLGVKAFSGQMSSSELDVMLVGVALSGLSIVPRFSQHVASVVAVAVLHGAPIALFGRSYDPDLPQFLAPVFILLVPILAWVHGHSRRRFLALAATSTFKLALACNNGSKDGDGSGGEVLPADPYFTEAEAEALQAEMRRETALVAERDSKRSDAPRHGLFVSSKVLGRGAYGIVSVAIDTVTNEKIALKQCAVGGSRGRRSLTGQRTLLKEIGKLRVLRHAHVIEYKASTLKNDALSLLLELCDGGSLKHVLRQGGPLSEAQAGACARQLLEALQYIHLLGLAHMDVKPQNVLIRQGGLKLSDFGSAKWVHSEGSRSVRGTLAYLAPEVARGEGGGRKADVWSFGAVALEMLTCELLWPALREEDRRREETQERVLRELQAMEAAPAIPAAASLSPAALALVSACLTVPVGERPTAYALRAHAFVQGADRRLDVEKFGAPGAAVEQALEEEAPWWWLGRLPGWWHRINDVFANPEMEREFLIDFSTPRLTLILSLARVDVVVRCGLHVLSLLYEPTYETAVVLLMQVPNLCIVFAPIGPEMIIKGIRWFVRAGAPFWLIFVRNRQPYFTNLWTVTLTMMIYCQLAVSVLETTVWFGILGVVMQLVHLSADIWVILHRAEAEARWREDVEDRLSLIALLVLTYATAGVFSYHYLKSERRKFFRAYYMRLAHEEWDSGSASERRSNTSRAAKKSN